MAGTAAYLSHIFSRQKPCWSMGMIVFLISLLFFPGISSFAQSLSGYDKTSVFLEVSNTGGKEIDALVKEDEILLPVNQVFDFLNIRIDPSTAFETISGFILDRGSTYSISWNKNEIQYGSQLFKLKQGDLINTDTDLYLKAKYFEIIFGLECNYSFKKRWYPTGMVI